MSRNQPLRPQFHFSAHRHWINDPNGLVWLEGEYHLFYQHNPFGDQWGHMSWGHAVSTDLVNWTELEVAIPEDERVSIYSGSVVVDHHNTSGFATGSSPVLVAIYTGCLRRPEGGQAQELAYSLDRGRTWVKYPGNPVLDLGLRDFRDPKVLWHEATRQWVMVVVLPDERKALFYGSPNLRQWHLLSEFDAPLEGQGIWECPDLIELNVEAEGTVWMLKVDVLAGHPSGGSGARIFWGQFDGTRFVAQPSETVQWADLGSDFYAALSFNHLSTHAPHPVWLAWMNCHRYAKFLPTHPWRGSMTLPREMRVRRQQGQLVLCQWPHPALQQLRRHATHHPGVRLAPKQEHILETQDLDTFEIRLQLESCVGGECAVILSSGSEFTAIGYDAQRAQVFIDRTHAGFSPAEDRLYAGRRSAPCRVPSASRPLGLQVWVDRSSVEVFVDDGHTVLSEQILPTRKRQALSLRCSNAQAICGPSEIWRLAPAQFA